jgi:glucose-6-phosphate isomerase
MNINDLKSNLDAYSHNYLNAEIELAGCNFNFNNQKIPQEFHSDFIQLAKTQKIHEKFTGIYKGDVANVTEGRSVSHFNYRIPSISGKYENHQKKLISISKKIREAGYEKVVFFGIGGSQLGPAFVGEALVDNFYDKACLITGSDPDEFVDKLAGVNLDKSCFIVASKSFSTLETLNSFEKVTNKKFLSNTYAVTAAPKLAEDYGIQENNIISFDINVGGRFSIWSPISILLSIFLGEDAYKEFLGGGHLVDLELLENEYESLIFNLSCQDIYHNNILGNQTSVLLNYDWKLRNFSRYAQQLEMESNGKSVDINGNDSLVDTNSIIWGGYGPESQHSFYQLLYQGTKDFNTYLIAQKNAEKLNYMQFLGQKQSLVEGTNKDLESYRQTKIRRLTSVVLDQISPKSVGALMAIWENKTILNSLIWNINAFDQWGVELGKLNTKKFSGEN